MCRNIFFTQPPPGSSAPANTQNNYDQKDSKEESSIFQISDKRHFTICISTRILKNGQAFAFRLEFLSYMNALP